MKRLIGLLAAILAISSGAWILIYFTASPDKRPQILKIALSLFGFSISGVILLLTAIHRRMRKYKDKNR